MLKNKSTLQTRNVSFDCLRIVAAIMVVMLHVAARNWYFLSPETTEWQALNFYDALTRSAVPLFFMLSGAFMLKKEVALKDLYFKKIVPLAIIYFVWSFLYAIPVIGVGNILSGNFENLISTTIDSHYHLWFIPTMIGIYMLQPILHAIVNYKEGKYVKYLIILFFVFGIVQTTLLLFITNNSMRSLLTTVPVELTGYSGYVLLGHFLANMENRKHKPWTMLLGFVIVVIISTIICQIDSIHNGEPSGILYGYFTIASFGEALFLFLFFKNIHLAVSDKVQARIYYLSSLTLGVYLLHPFIIRQFATRLHLDPTSFNTFIATPVLTSIIALLCFGVSSIMTKIPIVNKLWKY